MRDNKRFSLTRRAFLPILFTAIGLCGGGYLLLSQKKPVTNGRGSEAILRPRYRRKTGNRNARFVSNLPEGFFLNPQSKVIHYVDRDKSIHCVHRINQARLQRSVPMKAVAGSAKPRVNLACATYSYERAAISQIEAKDIDSACQLLYVAITHDLFSTTPSARLYDLLAGLALRFGKVTYLERIMNLIEGSDHKTNKLLLQRVTKWRDRDGLWYKRWADRRKPIRWKLDGTRGLVF